MAPTRPSAHAAAGAAVAEGAAIELAAGAARAAAATATASAGRRREGDRTGTTVKRATTNLRSQTIRTGWRSGCGQAGMPLRTLGLGPRRCNRHGRDRLASA